MADSRPCLHTCNPPWAFKAGSGFKRHQDAVLAHTYAGIAILGSSIFFALQPAIVSPTRSSSKYQGPDLVISFLDCHE